MDLALAALLAASLIVASLLGLFLFDRMPGHVRDQRTHDTVKLAIGLFVPMTSLVLGLLITTVKTNFDRIDQNVHGFATQIIMLDRALTLYGPDAAPARRLLLGYTRRVVQGTWAHGALPVLEDKQAEAVLEQVQQSLTSIKPPDARQLEMWTSVSQALQRIIETRWQLVGQSGGTITWQFLAVLAVWLLLIFVSFSYNAPRNPTVAVTFLLCALAVGSSVYLILDMDAPFNGSIRVSAAPMRQALEYQSRGQEQ